MLDIFLGRLEPQLATNEFIAGAKISIADITCYFVINMANNFEMDVVTKYPSIARWHKAFCKRLSAEA